MPLDNDWLMGDPTYPKRQKPVNQNYAMMQEGWQSPVRFHYLGRNNPSSSEDGFFYCPFIVYTALIPQSKTFAVL